MPSTLRIERVTRDCLIEFFGAETRLRDISEGGVEDFRNWLLSAGGRPVKRCGPETVVRSRTPLAEATTRKRCSIAGKFFRYAMRHGLVSRNPFEAVPKANIPTQASGVHPGGRRSQDIGRVAHVRMAAAVCVIALGRLASRFRSAAADLGRRGLGAAADLDSCTQDGAPCGPRNAVGADLPRAGPATGRALRRSGGRRGACAADAPRTHGRGSTQYVDSGDYTGRPERLAAAVAFAAGDKANRAGERLPITRGLRVARQQPSRGRQALLAGDRGALCRGGTESGALGARGRGRVQQRWRARA